jgi:hypothetical protein
LTLTEEWQVENPFDTDEDTEVTEKTNVWNGLFRQKPVVIERVSKHRAGRHSKKSPAERRREIRAQRQRISDQLDAKALKETVDA